MQYGTDPRNNCSDSRWRAELTGYIREVPRGPVRRLRTGTARIACDLAGFDFVLRGIRRQSEFRGVIQGLADGQILVDNVVLRNITQRRGELGIIRVKIPTIEQHQAGGGWRAELEAIAEGLHYHGPATGIDLKVNEGTYV